MRGRNLRRTLVAAGLVAASAVLVLVLAVAGLLAFIVTSAGAGSSWNASMDELSAALVRTEGGYAFTGGEYLAEKELWAMLVDEGGAVVWQQGKPAEVPDRYSLTDVAAFTRWYLSDYPVQVRVREDGLLVAGGPKGSTWKHPFVLDMDVLKTIPFWFAGLFLLALLLHDNPYSFLRNPRPASLLAADGAMDVAIELNSLSKSHSMAGWRIGMIGAAKQRIDEIIRFKSNMDSGMFYPMQAAAAKALSLGDDWYRSINKLYGSREAKAYEILNQIGCSYDAGQAGLFVWGRLPEGAGDCYEFSDKILNGCGVFLTPGGIFGSEGNRYVRISLCATEELLQRSIDKIKTLL